MLRTLLPITLVATVLLHAVAATAEVVIADKAVTIRIVAGEQEIAPVPTAIDLLASDIERLSARKPERRASLPKSLQNLIVVGAAGSPIVQELSSRSGVDFSAVEGEWESYLLQDISPRSPVVSNVLVVVGSDKRGTAYGVMELCRRLGVSPWHWWADVPPAPRARLAIDIGRLVDGPSVKYRGIFLNDERWALRPWAASQIDKDEKNIGPKTYARVFELLLRLKANTIWPAMHEGTRAFYANPKNPAVARDYGIIVGSSHCEPMLRNNIDEWRRWRPGDGTKRGKWDWCVNREQMTEYWRERVRESAAYESVYTLGIRGTHDGPMSCRGAETTEQRVAVVRDQIIPAQRRLLTESIGPAVGVPQVFCPYKDVLKLYRGGLRVPRDVTVVWPDDNMGYIRQLPLPSELEQNARHGIYYHVCCWRNLWLASISPTVMSYELTKAWENGARDFWILNVGDIKPMEVETDFFLSMAWDPSALPPGRAGGFVAEWYSGIFGPQLGAEIADIKRSYYRLGQYGRPEHLPEIAFRPFEARERLNAYSGLSERVAGLREAIPRRLRDAYFQLVYYPVVGSALMNRHVLKRDDAALQRLKGLTQEYNASLADGKWRGMMSLVTSGMQKMQAPARYYEFTDPGIRAPRVEPRDEPVAVVSAGAAHAISTAGQASIHSIPDLGIDDGLTLTPYGNASYSPDELDGLPSAAFKLELPRGEYSLFARFLPTYPINEGGGLRYAVRINGGPTRVRDLAGQKIRYWWSNNQIRGYMTSEAATEKHAGGQIEITLYLLDAGLVFNQFCIYQE
ncbi:MAG: glycosyl hydrolase 115 family protein [Planctomycetota bacterium]